MILKSLKLTNIRSFLDAEITFPEGSLLLSGDVGSGKSTVLLAVEFALFGLRRGELSGSDLLRHGKEHGYVALSFSIDGRDILVKRGLKRNSKGITQDLGEIVIDNRREECTPLELKARILGLFGYPKDQLTKNRPIFRYTVYTPQEEMKHIMLYPEDRLTILRKIFDIEKYGKIRENSRIMMTELRTMKRELESSSRDMDEKSKERDNKSDEKNVLTTRLEEQLKLIEEIDIKLENKLTEKKNLEKDIENLRKIKNDITLKETEIRMKEKRLEQIVRDLANFDTKISYYTGELKKYENLKKPEKDIKELREFLSALEKQRDSFLSEKALIASEIKNLKNIYEKGVCEVCKQDVHDPSSFKSNIDSKVETEKEFLAKLKEIDNEMEKTKKEQEEVIEYNACLDKMYQVESSLRDVLSWKNSLTEESNKITSEMQSLKQSSVLLQQELSKFSNIEDSYKAFEIEFSEIQKSKLSMENLKTRYEQQIHDIDTYIERLNKEIEEKTVSKKKIGAINELVNWFDSYFIRLMEIIERHVMISIQKEFDLLFRDWFGIIMGDDLEVRIDDHLAPVIEQNGYETDYMNLSGGEKTAVALSYRLALNKIINSLVENIKTKDLIILDEPTDGFSSDQLDRIRDVINELALKQIIIVSHEPKIDAFVGTVMKLYKDQHVSSIVN